MATMFLLASCTGDIVVPTEPGTGLNEPGTNSKPGGESQPKRPFEVVSPRIYVAKVKNLMLGLAPTEEEIAAVTRDPAKLRAYVEAWFVQPEAQTKFLAFFQNAFQQSQITEADLVDQGPTSVRSPALLASVNEMFARTALKIIAEKRPFTDVLTTRTFMMTPALMSLYLLNDQTLRSDDNKYSVSMPLPDGSLSTTFKAWATYVPPATVGGMSPGIPLADSLNPRSPKYLHFSVDRPFTCRVPKVDSTGHVIFEGPGRPAYTEHTYNERVFEDTAANYFTSAASLFSALLGSVQAGSLSTKLPPLPPMPPDVPEAQKIHYRYGPGCASLQSVRPAMVADDYVWRPVTIRPAAEGQKMVPFYDLPTLRQSNELVLRTPRVGFFTTPAFFANWPTNRSNQARVVMNQALIVALGKSINPIDSGPTTILETGKDGEHSDPTSPCYSCHQILDPMRQVFSKFFTYSYRRQESAAQRFSTANFTLGGMSTNLDSLDALATAIAAQPEFAPAWVTKLCHYANSTSCSPSDPEVLRVAAAFKASNFDFQTLVRELFSSPVITNAEETETWQEEGELVSIARQDHLCAALTAKLRLTSNLCRSIANGLQAQIVSNNIPSDGYQRGAERPVLSTEATMFFRGAAESLCQIAADQVIDLPMIKSLYTSAEKDKAITDFVGSIMSLTTADPIAAEATRILQDHHAAALAKGATATQALKSTFVVACTSPSSLAIGL
jgi:hypothetical protein